MGLDLVKSSGGPRQPAPEMGEARSSLSLRSLWQILRERGIWLLLVAVAGAAAAGYYEMKQPAKYQARAVLQVEQEEQKLISIEDVSRQDLRASEWLNTIVQNIRNSSVMLAVVRDYDLANDPKFLPGVTNKIPEARLARVLASMITAKLRSETRLIDVTATHSSPDMAQKLANAVARDYILQVQRQRFETTKTANQLLYQEAATLKDKLDAAERHLQEFKENSHTVSAEDRQAIISEKLRELNQKCADAQAERLRLEADFRQVQKLAKEPDGLLSLPQLLDNPAANELRREIAAQQAQVGTLAQRYKDKHPKMIEAQRQLDNLKESLRTVAAEIPRSIENAYQAAAARETNLVAAFKEAQNEALQVDRTAIDQNVLEREVQSERALYDSVVKRLKEVDLSKGLESSAITVTEAADRPNVPIKLAPNIVAAGTFAALFMGGFLLILGLRMAKGAIQTVDEAEDVLGLPVWAAIPRADHASRKALPHVLVEEPSSICSEGFRTLRTCTTLLARASGGCIQAFTSAHSGEGKSFCSLNQAICQAQQGKATLLIELDLRKPSLDDAMGLKPGTPGVTDYLTGKRPLSECIHATEYPNLFILPAGPLIAFPSEELAQETLGRMLAQLRGKYEQIVIDTAPILAVSDTFLILPFVDQICLVVRTASTPRRAINRALELMARAGVPPSGVVLNLLPKRSANGYYYYGADRAYGKKGVYGSNAKLLSASN